MLREPLDVQYPTIVVNVPRQTVSIDQTSWTFAEFVERTALAIKEDEEEPDDPDGWISNIAADEAGVG
jgi:hypothetical protein